jgi:hypothetical protein
VQTYEDEHTLLPQIMPTQAGSALASKFLRHTSSESNDASLVTSYTSIAPCQCVDTREVCMQALSALVALMHKREHTAFMQLRFNKSANSEAH